MISVEEVLNTSNLNDRMEMARLRHAQVIAQRNATRPIVKSGTATDRQPANMDTSHFAFVAGSQIAPATDNKTVAAYVAAKDKDKEPEVQDKRQHRGIIVLAVMAVVAMLISVTVPGPLRDLCQRLRGADTAVF